MTGLNILTWKGRFAFFPLFQKPVAPSLLAAFHIKMNLFFSDHAYKNINAVSSTRLVRPIVMMNA